jgi:hypothetical protein
MDLLEEIPVNSIVVAAKSRVLKAMLSSGMKASDKRAPITVKVTLEGKPTMQECLLSYFHLSSNGSETIKLPADQGTVMQEGTFCQTQEHCGLNKVVQTKAK